MNAHVMQAKFKVGDRVRVIKGGDRTAGRSGHTTPIGDVVVLKERCHNFWRTSGDDFYEHEIEHVAPSEKFKIGDRVRALVGYADISEGSIYTVIAVDEDDRYMPVRVRGDDGGRWWMVSGEFEAVQEGAAAEATKPTFEVGDRVRAKEGDPKGCVGVIVKDDGLEPRYLVRFDAWSKGHGDDGREWWLSSDDVEPAPLTIVAGRYYKTRDGRRVGPMVRNISDGGNAEYYWSAPMGQLGSYGTCWCKEGAYYKDGEQHNNDIIAEWPDEPEKAIEPAKPYRTSVAAQVDTIADEYGAGTKPKFKVGDRVRVLRTDFPNRIAVGEITHIVGVDKEHGEWADLWCRDFPSGLCFYPGEFELVTATHAIVALIENGQPLPATRPYVHPNRASAEAESRRLASKHPGKEFGVYEFVSSAKEAKTYAHEWQRLAAKGETINALRELRAMSGLGLATAKRAVEDWLSREAA